MKTGSEWMAFDISDDALERQAGTSAGMVPTLLLASYCFTCKIQGIVDAEDERASCDDDSPAANPRHG